MRDKARASVLEGSSLGPATARAAEPATLPQIVIAALVPRAVIEAMRAAAIASETGRFQAAVVPGIAAPLAVPAAAEARRAPAALEVLPACEGAEGAAAGDRATLRNSCITERHT
jgi:hypothetical protein